jgi:hypothetical protein
MEGAAQRAREMERFVRDITALVGKTRDYPESTAKLLLWYSLAATMIPDVEIESRVALLRYMDHQVGHVACTRGLVVYTEAKGQININLVVRATEEDDVLLLRHGLLVVQRAFPGYAISLEPLATHMGRIYEGIVKKRRFLSHPSQIADLHYAFADGDGGQLVVHHMGVAVPVRILDDVRALASYRPLTLLSTDDEDGTVYWHRCPDKTLLALRNPLVDVVDPDFFVSPTSSAASLQVCRSIDADVGTAMRALLPYCGAMPEKVYYNIVMHTIGGTLLPLCLRQICVSIYLSSFPLSDGVIQRVGEIFEGGAKTRPLVEHICDVYRVLIRDRAQSSYMSRAAAVIARVFSHEKKLLEWWVQWVRKSRRVHDVMMGLSDSKQITRLCKLHVCFLAKLVAGLRGAVGEWTPVQRASAQLAVQTLLTPAEGGAEGRVGGLGDPEDLEAVAMVRAELARLDALSKDVGESVVARASPPDRSDTNNTKAEKKRNPPKPRPPPQCKPEPPKKEPPAPPAASSTTHGALVARLAAHIGWPCELIGSGVLFDKSDADVVVTVADAPSLEEAYARVAAHTGWTPLYDRAAGHRVAVLSGRFEGVAIDAQVWRGRADASRAETLSAQALALAERMRTHLDAAAKARVLGLHQWATAAGLKGHKLCRLPGVAVACLAIVLGCDGGRLPKEQEEDAARSGEERGERALRRLLGRLRDVMQCGHPAVDFDEMTLTCASRAAGARPCEAPLRVVSDGENVASRMTAATSRHLLDCLLCAQEAPQPSLCDASHYAAWRRATMLVCARMRPASARAVPLSLHAATKLLGAHPLIATLHLEEEEGAEGAPHPVVVVRATLDADADAATYGFRDGDVVLPPADALQAAAPRVVTVRRGTRTWSLYATSAPPTAAWNGRARVTDVLPVQPGVAVPNAPYLTMDAQAKFDPSLWTVAA